MKKVLFFGVGGHGWKDTFLETIFAQPTVSFSSFALTVDYGGSAGLWYELQEIHKHQLNKLLHGESTPILPWADYNKLISLLLSRKYGTLVGETLNFRSDNYQEHQAKIEILGDFLQLTQEEEQSFHEYFRTSFEYYLQHKEELYNPEAKEFCLGYPWQEFVYWQLEGVESVNTFYKSKHVFPHNLDIYFTHTDRTQLLAKDETGRDLVGEEYIDLHGLKITAESQKVDTSVTNASLSVEFLEQLSQAELVIIPPGSLTNWIALFEMPEVRKILQICSQKQRLLWYLNPSIGRNEYPAAYYYEFLQEQGVIPKVIGAPNQITQNGSQTHGITLTQTLSTTSQGLYNPLEIAEKFPKLLDKSPQ